MLFRLLKNASKWVFKIMDNPLGYNKMMKFAINVLDKGDKLDDKQG
jgi:hypothetical protein